MPTAKINDIDIYFETHGASGEPLVLVHGYTGDITDWRHQLPEFSRTHRVLIMDHRGHGKSEAPTDRESYSIDQMSRDVEALISEVGFDRYHLLGHSMGGTMAQEIALRSPGRLMSLTLEDTSNGFRSPNPNPDNFMAKWSAARNKMAEEQGMAALANLPGLPPPPHKQPGRAEEEKARLASMSVDGFLGAARGMNTWAGTVERAASIATPTMVIVGELDFKPLHEACHWLAKTIRGAELVEIPEAQHSPQFERPELFNAALRRHLDRNAGGASK